MDKDYTELTNSIISIASELFRFQKVFEKAISKFEMEERNKYVSQFAWFSKKVTRALENAGLTLVNAEGQLYDPGMAITPLNINDFSLEDQLFVVQMIEPIIMKDKQVTKIGTAILGRIEK